MYDDDNEEEDYDDGDDEPSEEMVIGHSEWNISLGTRFPLLVYAPFQCSMLCHLRIAWLSVKCFDGHLAFDPTCKPSSPVHLCFMFV